MTTDLWPRLTITGSSSDAAKEDTLKTLNAIIIPVFVFLTGFTQAHAAVGCDLNDPDRDVRRLFPGSTGYKTEYVSIDRSGGPALLAEIEKKLGDSFSGLYETIDVPYTVYRIYKGKELLGYIHGVNQKGEYGGLQAFLAVDRNGVILNFYFQKLTSKSAAAFRGSGFASQFRGLSMADFATFDVKTAKGSGRAAAVKNPSGASPDDFRHTMRAVKKNLIIIDALVIPKRGK
jgi:hypothetical protein